MNPILPSGRRPNLPAGRYYDGATADWKLDAYGQVAGTHPADEGMAMSILVTRGECKSSPTTGNTLRSIQYLGGKDLGALVEAAVLDANPLQRLVSSGDVTITSIYYEIIDSRLVVSVKYVNNRVATESRLTTSHEKTLTWYG